MRDKRSAVHHEDAPTHVRQHLTSQPQSGLSIPQYCNKRSIKPWSFYQRRKRYQSELNAPSRSQTSFKETGSLTYSVSICDIRFPSQASRAQCDSRRVDYRRSYSGYTRIQTGGAENLERNTAHKS